MTRTYALFKLLEHGPLTFSEIQEICGWGKRICWRAVNRLIDQDMVRRESGKGRFRYSIVEKALNAHP